MIQSAVFLTKSGIMTNSLSNKIILTWYKDFESTEDRIKIFENLFAIKIEALPTEF